VLTLVARGWSCDWQQPLAAGRQFAIYGIKWLVKPAIVGGQRMVLRLQSVGQWDDVSQHDVIDTMEK
jgi:hypothetical protein